MEKQLFIITQGSPVLDPEQLGPGVEVADLRGVEKPDYERLLDLILAADHVHVC